MKTVRQWIGGSDLATFGKGFLMGGADIIPGVSGGTVALIVGIYARFVTALSRVDGRLFTLVKTRQWRDAAAYMDLRFLMFLVAGAGTGIVLLAGVMHFLLEHHRQLTMAVFFGLILGSSALVARMIPKVGFLEVLLIVVAGCAAFALVGILPTTPPTGLWYDFLAGAIAICAMLLPGVSGAFLLVLLGEYYEITGYVSGLKHGDITAEAVMTLTVFGCGCLFGLATFSKLLRWLLHNAQGLTLAAMCGLMLGSLRKIWPFQVDLTPDEANFKLKQFAGYWPEEWQGDEFVTIIALLTAAAFVFAMDYVTQGSARNPDAETEVRTRPSATGGSSPSHS